MTGRTTTDPETQSIPLETVGVILAERIFAGLVVDHKLQGALVSHPAGPIPADSEDDDSLVELPTDSLVNGICETVLEAAKGRETAIRGVGVAIPGLIRNGVVEEAPNLPQLKGARMQELVSAELSARGISAPVTVVNDADAMAAGIASHQGKLDHVVRVWTIGTGIGYGCYPFAEGVWEGGHTVVTLDDKENYCGCGGRGHLEGIMGHRAMRLRFLDMEPEEVFENANRRAGAETRCVEFKHLWHKSLAAATASVIHQAGARKFYVTGYNTRFLDLNLLKDYLHQMVKMSPLQSYSVELFQDGQTTRVVGAGVAAEPGTGLR
ncbi:MAG TPA: ROK family protein [Acidobacteriaceae bacterium]|jgi:predicted NBD/HSP70 family sugar kinase|nr:ROK family protein [Acidobacteriaceae bacterium]